MGNSRAARRKVRVKPCHYCGRLLMVRSASGRKLVGKFRADVVCGDCEKLVK